MPKPVRAFIAPPSAGHALCMDVYNIQFGTHIVKFCAPYAATVEYNACRRHETKLRKPQYFCCFEYLLYNIYIYYIYTIYNYQIMWKEQTMKLHPNPKPLEKTKDCRRWSVLCI